jgi:allantoin racemase
MKILYLMPVPVSKGRLGPGELARRRDLLRGWTSAEFDWDIGETDEGSPTIESIADEERCIPGMLRAAVAAQRDGFGGVVLGCFSDPGLESARSLLSIPVIGPAEASLTLACALGKSYGILTASNEVLPLIRKVVKTSGRDSRLAGIRTMNSTVLELAGDREDTLGRLIEAGELALTQDGADVLILGCMSLAFLNVAAELTERLGAPVVCPLDAAIGSAENLLRSGASPNCAGDKVTLPA